MKASPLAASVVAILVVAAPLRAGEVSLKPGATVRITTPTSERPIVGRLEDISPEGLRLRVANHSEMVTVSRSEAVRVEVRHGRRIGRGALVGAGILGGVGLGLGLLACPDSECDEFGGRGAVATFMGTAGLATGAAGGALVGAMIPAWKPVRADSLRIAVAPTRGGARAAVTLGWR